MDLLEAADTGNLEQLKKLLDQEADLNYQDDWGETALTLASINGHLEVVKELLNRGADLSHQDDWGETALIEASKNGHLEVVKELLNQGADVNHQTKQGYTALMWASKDGHVKVVKELLNRGANINHQNYYGDTAYDLIQDEEGANFDEIRRLLLKPILDPNLTNPESGITNLMIIAVNGSEEELDQAIDRIRDIDQQDKEGNSALHYAAAQGSRANYDLLIQRGANPNIQNDQGAIPSDYL